MSEAKEWALDDREQMRPRYLRSRKQTRIMAGKFTEETPRMQTLPLIMQKELSACSRSDCRIVHAGRDLDNHIISNNLFIECAVCNQVWELECSGGEFTHWDKSGIAHQSATAYRIASKWPRGEGQCENSGSNLIVKKFVDAKRP